MKRFLLHLFSITILTLSMFFSGCGIYSFTGASISPNVKTISIKHFPNNAQMVQPALSRKLTEALRDKFTNQSTLSLVNSNGDLNIEGEIIGYITEPVAITSDQKASRQRLKITINVRFTNKIDPKQNYESQFSRYADYDSRSRLSDVEEGLIDIINSELTDDIFNKSVVNW